MNNSLPQKQLRLTEDLIEVGDAVVVAVHVGAVEGRELLRVLQQKAASGVGQQLQAGQVALGRGHVHGGHLR